MSQAETNTRTFTVENFDAEVLRSDVPVLVDFWAEWCPPCKAIGPSIDALADAYAGRARVGKVDIEAQGDLAVRFGVNSIPTILIFENGRPTGRFVGLTSQQEMSNALDDAIG